MSNSLRLTEEQYIEANESFWSGPDETVIECRTTKVVTVRKDQMCMCPRHDPLHTIKTGERAVRDKAIADGAWGSCYVCLSCLEAWWNHCENCVEYQCSLPQQIPNEVKQ